MKRHAFSSALIVSAICLIFLLIVPVCSFTIGDIDNDNIVTAADARKILRISVGLDSSAKETQTAADVDGDKNITAADARLVLRYSVGLYKLQESHQHSYRYEQITDKNGNTDMENCLRICKICDEKVAVRHSFGPVREISAPTCRENGSAIKECVNCGYINEKIIPASHNPGKTATCTSAQICLDCGKEIIPSFNTLVNQLKNTAENSNKFSGFSTSEKEFSSPEYSSDETEIRFKSGIEEKFASQLCVSDKNTVFTKNNILTNINFHVSGELYVSNLDDSDIKSIEIEKTDSIDFVKKLFSSYKDENGKTVSLTKLKNSSPDGDFYKITVTVRKEKYSAGKNSNQISAMDKIYQKDYNKTLEQIISEKIPSFMCGMMRSESLITTDFNVIYYFDADTLKPVAAKYSLIRTFENKYDTCSENYKQSSQEPAGYVKFKTSEKNNDYYFFNNNFDLSAIS